MAWVSPSLWKPLIPAEGGSFIGRRWAHVLFGKDVETCRGHWWKAEAELEHRLSGPALGSRDRQRQAGGAGRTVSVASAAHTYAGGQVTGEHLGQVAELECLWVMLARITASLHASLVIVALHAVSHSHSTNCPLHAAGGSKPQLCACSPPSRNGLARPAPSPRIPKDIWHRNLVQR